MPEEIDLNKLREEVRKKNALNVAEGEQNPEKAINSRERFQALSPTQQLEVALADGFDNVPAYVAENFAKGGVDLNKLREQVKKIEGDKK